MTKADIVNLVFEKVGLPKNEVQIIVEKFFDTAKEALISGSSLKIPNFGTFLVRKKRARIGRNPRTKVEVEITPRRVVVFRASEKLKSALKSTNQSS